MLKFNDCKHFEEHFVELLEYRKSGKFITEDYHGIELLYMIAIIHGNKCMEDLNKDLGDKRNEILKEEIERFEKNNWSYGKKEDFIYFDCIGYGQVRLPADIFEVGEIKEYPFKWKGTYNEKFPGSESPTNIHDMTLKVNGNLKELYEDDGESEEEECEE